MPDLFLSLAAAFGTSSATRKPKFGYKVNQELSGGKPAILRIQRGGVATPAGNVTIYGANVSNPWANRANTSLFKQRADVTDANLVAADYQFLSAIDYAAFSNYNWLVQLDEFERQIVEIGATLGAQISSGTGAKARIDFTAETDTGDGSTTVFDLAADYELLTHCNLQVKVNSVVQAASAFTLSDNAGKIRITFTAAPTNTHPINYQLYPKPNKQFGLSLVTPATVKAAGVAPMVYEEMVTKDVHWLATGAGVTGTIDAMILAEGR